MTTTVDGRVRRGTRSRNQIMSRAVQLASVEGIDGLTIGRLAAESSVSKSGIVALFGSKEELQLATIAAAREIFIESVIRPVLQLPSGIRRLRAAVEAALDYSENRVFTGGCFFASAVTEFGSKSGPVRAAIVEQVEDWREFFRRTIAKTVELGELPADTNPEQLAFEIIAIIEWANNLSLLSDSTEPYERARAAAARLL